jgi:membrane protein implicated in regulation of membrane protease activity
MVIVCALLTVGSGYLACFAGRAAANLMWDVMFLVSAAGFLVAFLRYILTVAAEDFLSDHSSDHQANRRTGAVKPDKHASERQGSSREE